MGEMIIQTPISTIMIRRLADEGLPFHLYLELNTMKTLEIRDRDGAGCLSADLRDLLSVVGEGGKALHWKVHQLEARGDIDAVWPGGIVDLEDAVRAANEGIELSWTDLIALGESIDQTYDCRIEGLDAATSEVVVALEVVDSGYCVVETADAILVERTKQRFVDVRESTSK